MIGEVKMIYSRKVISVFLSVIAMITCILPTSAFAVDDDISVYEDSYTVEESEMIAYAEYEENSKVRATGLITDKNLYIKNRSVLDNRSVFKVLLILCFYY